MLEIGRWDLRVPEGTDGPADVPARMLQLATDLSDVAKDNQGTVGARPVSTALAPTDTPGAYYVSTDEQDPTGTVRRRIYRDHGAGYDELATIPVTRRMIDVAALNWTDTYANRAPGLNGQAGSVPAEGTQFTASDKGPMTWQVIGGAWVLVNAYPLRTTAGAAAGALPAFPASPVDGQEIRMFTGTAGVYWHLRYDAAVAGANKWAHDGGPDLFSGSGGTGTVVVTTAAGWVVWPTGAPPMITVPRSGDYKVAFGTSLRSTASVEIGLALRVNSDDPLPGQFRVAIDSQRHPGDVVNIKAEYIADHIAGDALQQIVSATVSGAADSTLTRYAAFISIQPRWLA